MKKLKAVFLIIAVLLSALMPNPLGGDHTTAQTPLRLVYPLAQRWRVSSLFDHNGAAYDENGTIAILSGDTVSDHPDFNPFQPDAINDSNCIGEVCGYTDGDVNLRNLRWDDFELGWLWYDGHPAYDYDSTYGTPVAAVASGTAYYYSGLQPNAIRVVHSGGYETYYGHLGQRLVSHGQSVSLGQQIGTSGTAGTGAHLHFEVQHNGTRVDPEDGLWVGGDPLPMGYRDQSNITYGPFALDNTKIRQQWLALDGRLGSPLGNDYSGPAPPGMAPQSPTLYAQNFERGYIYYIGIGSAQYQEYAKTYLPDIRANESINGWNSTIVIRNNNSVNATVNVAFCDQLGHVLDSRTYVNLSAHGIWSLDVRNALLDFLNQAYYVGDFTGSAVVAASEDVSVVVENYNTTTGRAYSYNGVAAADPLNPGWGEVGTTLYAPSIYNNQWGYNSTLKVMNTGSATATVQVHFKRRLTCGNCVDTTRSYTIVSGGSEEIPASSVLGTASWYGSLVIESSNGQPVAAVVHTSGSQFNRAYNTVSAGNGVIYLPMAYKNQWSMTSGLIVQNVGSQSTAVTVALYDRENNGQPHATIVLSNIAAGRAEGLWLGDLDNLVLPDGWAGWVKLTSQNGQPLAVTSHTKRYESQCAYAGAFQSGQAVILPSAAKNAGGPTTGYIVLNTSGSLSVQVAPVYYAVSGGISLTPSSYWLGWLEAKGQYQADDSLPDDWAGSILLPAQSGESLVAVMRQDRGTTTTGCYNGVVR